MVHSHLLLFGYLALGIGVDDLFIDYCLFLLALRLEFLVCNFDFSTKGDLALALPL